MLEQPLHKSLPRCIARTLTAFAVLVTLLLGLSACGGGDKTVATVGHTKLSQATLSHWMRTTLGGDYRAELSVTAPEGLVSDPPDYDRCVSVARQIAPKPAGKPALTTAQLRVKCRQLNVAIKEQALGYVLSVLWAIEEAAELGIPPPSEGEVSRRFREIAAHDYHSPAEFLSALSAQRRSVADERFLIKRNLLETKFLARLHARMAKLGGGYKTESKLILENNAKWIAKIDCSPGYLAWECRQYGSSKEASPSPAVVLQRLTQGLG